MKKGVKFVKKSIYANIIKQGDKAVVHNSLFGGIIKATCEESCAFLEKISKSSSFAVDEDNDFHNELIKMRIIVDENVNEENLVHFYYMQMQKQELLTIPFVTKQCNFRCVYCYEVHDSESMQSETYDKLYKNIEQLLETGGYKRVTVSYFGGEPLLEYEQICAFSQKVKKLAEKKKLLLQDI